jgi:hypothetical protein
MTVAIIVVIAFYFILFVLGYVFGRMDKKSNQAPMKPLEVKYTRYDLKQWAARQAVDAEEFDKMDSQVIERYVAGILADKFKAVIQNHMTAEKDYYRRKVIYSIDIWLRKDD